jgi:hypothetical protein
MSSSQFRWASFRRRRLSPARHRAEHAAIHSRAPRAVPQMGQTGCEEPITADERGARTAWGETSGSWLAVMTYRLRTSGRKASSGQAWISRRVNSGHLAALRSWSVGSAVVRSVSALPSRSRAHPGVGRGDQILLCISYAHTSASALMGVDRPPVAVAQYRP